MPDTAYPEGVTSMDHARHDFRMGRYPNQSSVETFLKEMAALAAQETVGHWPSGQSKRDGAASLHDEMVEALKEAEDIIDSFQDEFGQYDEDSFAGIALRKIRSVLAKATGSRIDPA